MGKLRLTSTNLEFMKRLLQSEHPRIRSAHRTEALAAACGFRTYASLLAEIRSSGSVSPIVDIDGARWTARLAQLGYGIVMEDRLKALLLLQQLPNPCWKAFRAHDRVVAKSWFYSCKAENLPYVTIELARNLATLEWDCITLDTKIDQGIRDDESGTIVKALFAAFQRCSAGSGSRPKFCGSAFVGSIESLQPDVARLLAGEFFMALYQASRPSDLVAA